MDAKTQLEILRVTLNNTLTDKCLINAKLHIIYIKMCACISSANLKWQK